MRAWNAAAAVAGIVLGTSICLGQVGGSAKPLPDEWFYDGSQRAAPLKALEGKPAPELSIDSWIGEAVKVVDSRGKVVVVDFWATWCGPCMAAIPKNVELVKKYKDQGLVFIGVHDSNAGWDRADSVVKNQSINYPVGVDKSDGSSVKAYAVQFWPTYVVIDRAGVIRGAGLMPDRVEDAVKLLLAEDAPQGGPAAAAEFGPEHYYGGAKRPKSLRELEGKKAPQIAGQGWIGKDPGPSAWKDSVVVLTFVSPEMAVSVAELQKLAPVEKEFGPQGVVFMGVCDGRAPWEKMEEKVKATPVAWPIMRDGVGEKVDAQGKRTAISTGAAAYGIEHYPATVIIDRAGKVRAAGVKADKIKPIVEKLLAESVGTGG